MIVNKESEIANSKSSVIKPKNCNYMAIDQAYRKICIKTYTNPNLLFLTALKSEHINIYLDNFSFKEIVVINKIIGNFYNFKSLTLSPSDPNSIIFLI